MRLRLRLKKGGGASWWHGCAAKRAYQPTVITSPSNTRFSPSNFINDIASISAKSFALVFTLMPRSSIGASTLSRLKVTCIVSTVNQWATPETLFICGASGRVQQALTVHPRREVAYPRISGVSARPNAVTFPAGISQRRSRGWWPVSDRSSGRCSRAPSSSCMTSLCDFPPANTWYETK